MTEDFVLVQAKLDWAHQHAKEAKTEERSLRNDALHGKRENYYEHEK